MIPAKTPVLLLKTKSTPADGYEEYFLNLDGGRYQPIFVPVLEHRFTRGALQSIKDNITEKAFLPGAQSRYGGLIFTSQRAVEAFTKVIDDLRDDGVAVEDFFPSSLPIYVVGPATAKALRALKLPCQIVGEETGNGEALAHYMLQHYHAGGEQTDHTGSKPGLLFLVGEQRRDIIPKTLTSASNPIDVEELTVYETGVMESFSHDFSELALPYFEQNKKQWVIVFSPTGCKAMLQVLGMLDESTGKLKKDAQGLPRNTHIATIGPTTRDYLKNEFGFEPDVCAATPSAEGLGEGILAFEKSLPA